MEGINSGKPRPEKGFHLDPAHLRCEHFSINVGQDKSAQQEKEIDPEITASDSIGQVFSAERHRKEVKNDDHQGRDTAERRQAGNGLHGRMETGV
jgi:hypothetical protein